MALNIGLGLALTRNKGVPANALRSAINGQVLRSAIDGRVLTSART